MNPLILCLSFASKDNDASRGSHSAASCYALAYAGTGRSNSGLKNRLARAAKMIGVKPITAA